MAAGSHSSIAPERTTAPAAPRRIPAPPVRMNASWLAAQGRLPLAFMGLALAWLATATAMLVLQPDTLALPHAAPAVVALTHAWALGFFVTVAAGAMYQLAPVALGTTLWRENFGWWHLGLHGAGVPVMVAGFERWDMRIVGVGGTLVTIGIVLFALNTWATVRRAANRDAVAWSLGLAAGWLLVTAVVGLSLAANRWWNFWPVDPLPLLRAHAHLGLVGFFLTLLQGVTFRLVPMFILGDVPDWKPVRSGLWLSQLGLIGLVPALACHSGVFASFFGAVIAVGFLLSGRALQRSLATRMKRRFDPGVGAFLRGTIGLMLAAMVGVVLAWPKTPWSSAPGGLGAMGYAVLVFAAGLLPAIAGMMCKIVPFLTWMRAYGPKVGRAATPPASALTSPRIEYWALALQGVAVIPLLAGAWTLHAPLLRLGAAVLALGVGLFLYDMLGVLKHLWWPQTAAAPAVTKPVAP